MTLRTNTNIFSNSSVDSTAIVTEARQNRIKKLPPLLVNQLAAGEVVSRPAAVVKELMENAIDAGATSIDVRITQGGMASIEVSDNGCGIHPDDMIMAVTRYATSKIANVAELQGIATLGFRGEALAATAAVSRLTLSSSHDDSGIGRVLNVVGILDDTPELRPIVHKRGTTVTVKDLYFNVPARRNNLKSLSTEFNHIETVVKQLALVASDIDIRLWHNDKLRFHFRAVSPVVKDIQQQAILMQYILARLNLIYPSLMLLSTSATEPTQDEVAKSASFFQPLTVSLSSLVDSTNQTRAGHRNTGHQDNYDVDSRSNSNSNDNSHGVYGFLLPYFLQSNTTTQNLPKLIYINGRLVKDRRIGQSLRESHKHLPTGYELGYVLFFELPTAWLNLNVHPEKLSVKIHNFTNINAHLSMGVRNALQQWRHAQPKVRPSETPNQPSMPSALVTSNKAQSKSTENKTSIENQQGANGNQNLLSQRDKPYLNNQTDASINYKDSVSGSAEMPTHQVTEFAPSYQIGQTGQVADGQINSLLSRNSSMRSIPSLPNLQCLYLMEEGWALPSDIHTNLQNLTSTDGKLTVGLAIIQANTELLLFSVPDLCSALDSYLVNNGNNDNGSGSSNSNDSQQDFLQTSSVSELVTINKALARLSNNESVPVSKENLDAFVGRALTHISLPQLLTVMLQGNVDK